MNTPVLFLIYNRPQTTYEVFDAIRQAKPAQLFVAADGPRENRLGESEKCAKVRRIIDTVDWDCEVMTLYREKNLGCRKAVSSAIDWYFDNVEEGIILEDDCLPSPSFFSFCEELLHKYRDDNRVMQICGSNFLKKAIVTNYSYYFSNYGPIWGWASWRRAWKLYDVDLALWPEIKEQKLHHSFSVNSSEAELRERIYDDLCNGKLNTWDYQWGLAKLINSGLSVVPLINLISNIGFGDGATHTVSSSSNRYAARETKDIALPLTHPPYVLRDPSADKEYIENFMLGLNQKRTDTNRFFQYIKKLAQ